MENFKKECIQAYEDGHSKLTDAEFDRVFGDNHEEFGFEGKVMLPFWMGSLDKVRTQHALDNWLGPDTEKNIFVSAKIDGVSALYHDGKMFTRGNGKYGQDISKVLKYLNLPNVKYTVRGELAIKQNVFIEKYKSTTKKGDQIEGFKTARNMVAGLLNRKYDGYELYDITFYAYEIVGKTLRPSEQYFTLNKDGFTVPVHVSLTGPQNFDDLYNSIFNKELETETDGIVIVIDDPYIQPTKGNPKFAIALKKDFDDDTRVVNVKEVEWNISRWRLYKPVVIIEPIDIKGVTITRTSGFNAKYIFNNKINTGSILRIKRSGDVIPTIVDVLLQSDSPSLPPVEKYIWNGVDLVAPKDTQEENIKKIVGVVSCLGIKHLNRATVTKLYEAGFTSLLKVIMAGKDEFVSAGIGEKMSIKITTSIYSLFFVRGVDVVKLMSASGCFGYGIGNKMVQLLFEFIPNFMITESVSRNEMVAIPGFSGKRAVIVEKNYKNALDYLHLFTKNGVKIVFPTMKVVTEIQTQDSHKTEIQTQDSHNGILKCNFVFTGFRDPVLEAKLDVFPAVSGKTDYLVVKSTDLKTTKISKAKKLGVKIITLAELQSKLNLTL